MFICSCKARQWLAAQERITFFTNMHLNDIIYYHKQNLKNFFNQFFWKEADLFGSGKNLFIFSRVKRAGDAIH
ncbi:hypothetical protein B5F55_04765 [Anaerotruncus colihominis]|nr:hypothetical protein B5F55_04765 [Anaerotruncus colihominis]